MSDYLVKSNRAGTVAMTLRELVDGYVKHCLAEGHKMMVIKIDIKRGEQPLATDITREWTTRKSCIL